MVSQVKERFMSIYETIKDEIEESDVKLIFENESLRYAERYLERQGFNVKKATDQIVKTLKWRKSERLIDLQDSTFPSFFHRYGSCFVQGTDLEGNAVLYMRIKLLRNFNTEINSGFLKFLIHNVFKADRLGVESGHGWTMVMDLTGVSAFQADLKYVVTALNLYINYCPSGLRKVIVHKLHFMLRPLFKAATAMMPKSLFECIVTTDEKTIFQQISKDNLPSFMGGQHSGYGKTIPAGCPSMETFMATHFPQAKNYEDSLKKYEALIAIDVNTNETIGSVGSELVTSNFS